MGRDMMLLKAQLAAEKARFEATSPDSFAETVRASIAAISHSNLLERALKGGDSAPAFRLHDRQARPFDLDDHLARGPVVLSFFRGEWCPYCALELDALSEASEQIRALGASLVAVSPDAAAASPGPGRETERPFPLLEDPGLMTARKYGVAFRLPDRLRSIYSEMGLPPAAAGLLPVPSTYVIDRSGRIILSYIDPDFTTRLEPDDIIVALRCLREQLPVSRS